MPAHAQSTKRLKEIVEIVQSTSGWGAVHGEKTIYLTSPDGERYSIPVKLGELNLKNTIRWLEQRGLDLTPRKNPAHPDGPPTLPEPVQAPQQAEEPKHEVAAPEVKPTEKKFVCQDCAADGKSWGSDFPQGLGRHRKSVHGVVGVSKSAKHRRQKTGRVAQTANARAALAAKRSTKTIEAKGARPVAVPDAPATTEVLMSQVDTALSLMREEIVAAVGGLHDSESVAALQHDNDSLMATINGIRHAIDNFPMAKAFAVIADLVTEEDSNAQTA